MKAEFKNMLLIGCRTWVGKDNATHSGGVLYDPDTAETLNVVSDLELKDSLSPVSGTINISVLRGKGGAEWTKVQIMNIRRL